MTDISTIVFLYIFVVMAVNVFMPIGNIAMMLNIIGVTVFGILVELENMNDSGDEE